MLRAIFIYLSKASWARKMVTRWKFAWRTASRFVAGESLENAIRAIKELNAKGINATLDHLGEHTTTLVEAERATRAILEAIDSISQSGVRSNVSIKLTQIGLALDEKVCADNLARILARAQERNNFVRIDMEDSPWVETTLKLYQQMRQQDGYDCVGVVIQAYLYRSEGDIRTINASCGHVRLCKGAYKEPPEVAYPKKGDVDANFDRLARLLIDNAISAHCPPVSVDGVIIRLECGFTQTGLRISNAIWHPARPARRISPRRLPCACLRPLWD